MLAFVFSCVVVLVVSFLCSLAEAVLLSLNPVRLETMKQEGRRHAGAWLELRRNVDRPIAAILILNTVAHTGGATIAGSAFDQIWGDRHIWIFSTVFTVMVLLGTEIAPKVLGVAYSSRLAPLIVGPLQWSIAVLRPVIFFTDRFARLFKQKGGGHGGTEVEAADLVTLARLARSRSLIDPSQEQIIVGAARLREMTVADVMLPRDEIVFFRLDRSTDENIHLARESLHTRYPVSETTDADGICAYANIKEIFALEPGERAPELHPYLRRVLFIDPGERLNEALRLFIARKGHFAVVKDAGGRVQGLLTLEDVLDEIVGEIEDDLDAGAIDFVAAGPGRWKVGGGATLGRIAETLRQPAVGPADLALGDFVAAKLGPLGRGCGVFVCERLRFTVVQVRRRRAHMVLVELLPEEAGSAAPLSPPSRG